MAKKRNDKANQLLVYALLLMAAFSLRVVVVRLFPNDAPVDGTVYSQLARNLVEQQVYSHETEPPYTPSLIRLPGYPLFLAGVYSLFGHHDNTPVRVVQALLDTATCALIALLAFFWEPDKRRKRSSSIAALVLAAGCPFTVIYVATILTETPTMFFEMGMCLTATLALTATKQKKALWLWIATGLIAGAGVLFRPDSGLFALAIGITLVVASLGRASDLKLTRKRDEMLYRSARASYLGAIFSLAFCLVLVPWAIRNYRVFHVFQPLAPAHAEMPGEFVPHGYLTWVSTWIDDKRYVGPVIWRLDAVPINIADIPDRAFDSAEEKQRVATLLEAYNHAPEDPEILTEGPDEQSPPVSVPEGQSEPNVEDETGEADDSKGEQADEMNEAEGPDENAFPDQAEQSVEMTPAIDAAFAQIARARISRHPFRYYVRLPFKRAHSIWFDTHSDYYPFQGTLLPLSALNHSVRQQFWLPLFAVLTLVYSVLGIAGGWFLWQKRNFDARLWVLLATLMIFLRIGYFATLSNPEPRYTVEAFPLLAILGGIAVTQILTGIRTKVERLR